MKLFLTENKYFDIDSIYHNFNIPSSHLFKNNLWFLKVTNLNRGRGIYVFNSIDNLISLINDWAEEIYNCTIVRDQENQLAQNAALKARKIEFIKCPSFIQNKPMTKSTDEPGPTK